MAANAGEFIGLICARSQPRLALVEFMPEECVISHC